MNCFQVRGAAALALMSLALGGCSAGVANAPLVATVAPLVVTPTSMNFIALGAGTEQTFTATEAGYTGSMSENDTCAGIATVAPAGSITGASVAYNVTPLAAGSCGIAITDASSQKVNITISVTTSGLVVQ